MYLLEPCLLWHTAANAKENTMPRILLTGFEPFGNATSNPSQQLVETFGNTLHDAEIVVEILPVATQLAPRILERCLIEIEPDYCIMLGLAEGRAALSLEQVAINLCDFRIPDNSGIQLCNTPIAATGPDAYFSSLPIQAMRNASLEAGIPAEISLSAGAFLCNQVFYHVRHFCQTHNLATQAGFIHLPASPELSAQSARPIASMTLDTMAAGLRAMLAVLEGVEAMKQ
jgi:pyroglutamyl-peptidase